MRSENYTKSIFTLEDVKEVLRRGNDSLNNTLVINDSGEVELFEFGNSAELSEVIKLRKYPVRIESFIAGGGYVGSESSLNSARNSYLVLLQGWIVHLKSGSAVFQDYNNMQEEEMIEEIKRLLNK